MMIVERRYCLNVSQSDDYHAYTQVWENVDNIKENDSNYASCTVSRSNENYSKPAVLYLTNFNFNIPSYAEITHIRVGYKDYMSENLNLTSPLFRILGGYGSAYGHAIPQNSNQSTEHIISRDNNQLLPTEVNTGQFGVSIEYPTNNANTNGTLYLDYVWIEIEYELPSYFLTVDTEQKVGQGEEFNITLNLKNTSTNNYNQYLTSVKINLPQNLVFGEKVSGAGTISYENNEYYWNTVISKGTTSITFSCQAENTGNYLLQVEEVSTGVIATKTILVQDLLLDISCDISEYLVAGDFVEFTVKATTSTRTSSLVYVQCELPECFNFISDDGDAFYVEEDGEFVFNFENAGVGECVITCEVLNVPGNYTLTFEYDGEVLNVPFTIYDSNLGTPYESIISLDANTLSKMQEGVTYTFVSYLKVLEREAEPYNNTNTGPFEFRMIVSSDGEIVTSSRVEQANTYVRKEVEFTYTGENIQILMTGAYPNYNPEKIDFIFTEPQIIETEAYKGLEERALLPLPLQNILSTVDSAHVVIPAKSNTSKIKLSNIDWAGFISQKDIAIHEIKCNFNIQNNIPVIASASLITPSNTVNRSEIIPVNDGNENYTIGKDYDIWNLKHADLDEYKDLEIELQLKNTYNNPVTIDIRNFQIQFKYIELENNDAIGFSINGDHCKYYGIFLDDRDLGLGFNSTVKEHREDGSDFAIEYLQNVKSKTITIEAYLQACTMKEAVILTDKITKLITTKRTRNNKPILKKLRFDDMPGRYWEYMLEDEIGWSPNDDQKLEFKLTVPDGVAKSDNEIIGTEMGYIDSITKINPIILLTANIDGNISITDTITGQNITVRDNTILAGDLIRINCRDRTVERIVNENNVDITNNTDINSDFFSLIEDYNLETNNTCTIQSVTYREAL